MASKGFSHVGLSTLDLDKTRDFYVNVLGFKPVRSDIIPIREGGQIRHMFFDTGRDQLIAFMEARGVPGIPAEYDAGINRGLGERLLSLRFRGRQRGRARRQATRADSQACEGNRCGRS